MTARFLSRVVTMRVGYLIPSPGLSRGERNVRLPRPIPLPKAGGMHPFGEHFLSRRERLGEGIKCPLLTLWSHLAAPARSPRSAPLPPQCSGARRGSRIARRGIRICSETRCAAGPAADGPRAGRHPARLRAWLRRSRSPRRTVRWVPAAETSRSLPAAPGGDTRVGSRRLWRPAGDAARSRPAENVVVSLPSPWTLAGRQSRAETLRVRYLIPSPSLSLWERNAHLRRALPLPRPRAMHAGGEHSLSLRERNACGHTHWLPAHPLPPGEGWGEGIQQLLLPMGGQP